MSSTEDTAARNEAAGAVMAAEDHAAYTKDDEGATTTKLTKENDDWADDGILEYYWGEHIHLGYYSEEEMKVGYTKKNFIKAKYDLIDEMIKFGRFDLKGYDDNGGAGGDACTSKQILDVGCGIGGTSRYLAKKLGASSSVQVTGINISPGQVNRATELAQQQGITNVQFQARNALHMKSFEDDTFDVVWSCECGEQLADKQQYIREMIRVLKPGGKLIMSTWCQRDDSQEPFTKKDLRDLQYFSKKWTLPPFISIRSYTQLLEKTGVVEDIKTDNWARQVVASWRHAIWVGLQDPMGWIGKPKVYIKSFRDAFGLECMHRAFRRGLMEYGVFVATKKMQSVEAPSS